MLPQEPHLDVDQPVELVEGPAVRGVEGGAEGGSNCAPRRTKIWRKRSSLLTKNEYTEPTENSATSATSLRWLRGSLAAEDLLGRVEQLVATQVLALQSPLFPLARLACAPHERFTIGMTVGKLTPR